MPDHRRDVCRGLTWVLLLALLAAQVWALYLMVPGEGAPYFAHQDKVGHFLIFGLPFALALVLRSRPWALGIVAHALASEVLQGILTSRTMDPWDTVANLAGIATAALVVWLVRAVPGRRAPVREAASAGSVP